MHAEARAAASEPRDALFRLITGFQVSQAISVAATLGLPNLLHAGPRHADELAAAAGADPSALYRLMRALAAIDIFREVEPGVFALTTASTLLRDDVVGTHAPMARLFGSRQNWLAWGALLHAVRSGTTAFDHVNGCGVWDYRERHPDEARLFDGAMASGTERYAAAVLEAVDFSVFNHIVDVGGGDGMFLTKILTAHPRAHGTLFDRPDVVVGAATSLASAGVIDRCRTCGGDFFTAVPAGADAYLLKWILHDWDDDHAIAILRTIRRAMAPVSRLFVVEHVIGPPNAGPDGKFLDLMMLVMTGGRERSRDDFAKLFSAAGLRIGTITATATILSVIEAAPG
jgi:hypothetical protein